MKLAVMHPLTTALMASALTLAMAGCHSIKPKTPQPHEEQTTYRYNANAAFPSFIGSTGFQQGQLDSLLKNSSNADPMTLLVGANTALKQGRLTDAGLLYQEAQIRRIHDLQRFPPKPEGAQQVKSVMRLKNKVGSILGPKLLEQPKVYAQIAERLERWRCDTGLGYAPGWAYGKAVAATPCAAAQQQKVRLMRDLSVLMSQPDYANAAQLAEYYQNSSSSVRELAGLKEGYLKALATMRAIERKQKRIGLSTRF